MLLIFDLIVFLFMGLVVVECMNVLIIGLFGV